MSENGNGDGRRDRQSESERQELFDYAKSVRDKHSSQRHDLLFKIMLWSLGLAVALGVLAALTASFDVVGRVSGTAVLTSFVAAILWRLAGTVEAKIPVVSRIMDVTCGGFYLFGLCGIWSIGDEGKTWGTAAALLIAGTLAAGGCWQTSFARFRLTGFLVVGAAGPALLCWLLSIWSSDRFDFELFATGLSLISWMAPAAVSLVGWTPNDQRYWRWLGVAAAVVGLVVSVVLIYDESNASYLTKLATIAGSVCAVVMHANLVLLATMNAGQNWIRLVTIATVIMCAICVDAIVLSESSGDNFLIRLTIAFAILSSGGTIAIAFIAKRNSGRPPSRSSQHDTQFSEILVLCPACGEQQQLPVGQSRCVSCELEFEIHLRRR